MSTDAQPLTESAPAADADPRPDLPRWEDGPDKLPLTVSWRECIRDMRWIEEQFSCCGFAPYEGRHVAVWDRTVIDADPDLLELRARLREARGVNSDRVSIIYIEPPIVT
jgi:hypothetical protein